MVTQLGPVTAAALACWLDEADEGGAADLWHVGVAAIERLKRLAPTLAAGDDDAR
jgi:hypothetical protein